MTIDTDRSLMDALIEASFTITGMLGRTAAANDLSLTQMRLLAILRDRRPRMAELAAHLGLDRSTVSGLIDRAVARGLLERIPSPDDRRSVLVSLTDEGRALAERLSDEMASPVAQLTDRMPPADRARLLDILRPALDAGHPDR